MVSELPQIYRGHTQEIVKLLTLFKENNMPKELLVACAERYEREPIQVNVVRRYYAHISFQIEETIILWQTSHEFPASVRICDVKPDRSDFCELNFRLCLQPQYCKIIDVMYA